MLIYVLDDDVIELKLWEQSAKELPTVTVRTFTSAMDFRIACLEKSCTVAVIDAVMPIEPGYEVCKWLKECCPDIRMVINTSLEAEQYRIMAELLGACFIRKRGIYQDRMEALDQCQSTLSK